MIAAMAAPAQSPLRRWKQFIGAFEFVDAAIEAADPVLLSRREFRSARDDDRAEQLCLVLDDVMAEYLETLRLVPAMPAVLATTDLSKTVGALQKHDCTTRSASASSRAASWPGGGLPSRTTSTRPARP